MNANDDNVGSDHYTNVHLGMKSFWGSLGLFESTHVWKEGSGRAISGHGIPTIIRLKVGYVGLHPV
jgi:hypothetical protein